MRTWEPLAQLLDRRRLLLLSNLLVLLLVGRGAETLPWQPTAQEVHEDVAKGLQVVAARLLASQVRVDGHVTRGARKRFTLSVRYMHLRLRIAVVLRHTEI